MKKKNPNGSPVKLEIHTDQVMLENEKTSPTLNQVNGHSSPQQRRRMKRSSITSNALLTTVASVHELMSFVIYKDYPPNWLKQTDLYREYETKSQQISSENAGNELLPQYYQPTHRKQRSNLHIYARENQSLERASPVKSSMNSHSSPSKAKRDVSTNRKSSSPVSTNKYETVVPLHPSVKPEPIEQNTPIRLIKSKSKSAETNRQRKILFKKKLIETSPDCRRLRRHRINSVENQEPVEKKDSYSSSSPSSSRINENGSSSSSSSIEHTSPSPTTTVSRSSSRRSSPLEFMRGLNSTPSSPLRIQTSISSPETQNGSRSQRRSTRIWAPSNFYVDPMWVIPPVVTSSKRSIDDNSSSSPSPSDSTKRPRRRCRS